MFKPEVNSIHRALHCLSFYDGALQLLENQTILLDDFALIQFDHSHSSYIAEVSFTQET